MVIAVLACVAAVLAVPAGALAAGSISGTVTDEAAGHLPIEDVRVCAFDESGEELEQEPDLGVNCELTDASGDYTIALLPPGEYVVEFWPGFKGKNYISEYYDDQSGRFEADLVGVTTTAKTGIDAELTEGGQVHGKVVSEVGGDPVNGAVVCVEEEESPWYVECTQTDHQGEYAIVGLPGGSYWLEFSSPKGSDFLEQVYSEIQVTLGAVTLKNATLTPGGRITGQVTDAASHAALEGIYVCAIEIPEEEFGSCTKSISLGVYMIRFLRPGIYNVVFAPFADEEEGLLESQYVTQFFNAKPTAATANPIALPAGVTRQAVNAALVKKSVKAVVTPPPFVPQATPPVTARPIKKLHCRKGFHKRKVKGKPKCVKPRKKKHHKATARPYKSGLYGPPAHGRALHLRARLR